VAWRGGTLGETLGGLVLSAIGVTLALSLPRPLILQVPLDPTSLRVGTLNLRGGYSLYFGSDLNATAEAIRRSGVDILLLQEAETGRLISGGVDQVAWLARTLNMNAVYLPTVEGLQGLAVLSRLPILQSDGAELSAIGKATAVQFVRLLKPNGALLDIYNTQLSLIFRSDVFSIQQLESDQARQIQEILAFIELNRSEPNALILGGTFNHAPKTDVYLFLSQPPQNFVDPFADFPEERAVTRRLVNEAAVRVDYLWLRRVRPLEVGITPMPFSSHDMPVVKIALN
jgi:endonuclease/exonuclease/phosphatase family metal-dependent hydrolase